MFRMVSNDAPIKWPVTIHTPVDGGESVKSEITAHFMLLPLSEAADLVGDQAFLESILVGWDGVQDEAGNPLPFTAENRDRLCEISYVKSGILAAYFECSSGAARKNSRKRRGTG